MKDLQEITANVEANKEIKSNINKKLKYYSTEQFINDAHKYISAITQNRMICIIPSVSKSGMSRNLKFISCEHSDRDEKSYYRNYIAFFIALGYTEARAKDGSFTVGGCGMDMVFHTNYTIMHRLEGLGFLTKEETAHLAQQTPSYL
jgi:hypothetical protein